MSKSSSITPPPPLTNAQIISELRESAYDMEMADVTANGLTPSAEKKHRIGVRKLHNLIMKKGHRLRLVPRSPPEEPPRDPGVRDVFVKSGVNGLPELYECYQQRRNKRRAHREGGMLLESEFKFVGN